MTGELERSVKTHQYDDSDRLIGSLVFLLFIYLIKFLFAVCFCLLYLALWSMFGRKSPLHTYHFFQITSCPLELKQQICNWYFNVVAFAVAGREWTDTTSEPGKVNINSMQRFGMQRSGRMPSTEGGQLSKSLFLDTRHVGWQILRDQNRNTSHA